MNRYDLWLSDMIKASSLKKKQSLSRLEKIDVRASPRLPRFSIPGHVLLLVTPGGRGKYRCGRAFSCS
jgi:hypothetical protein